jgi:hypothetical protein
MKEKIPIILSKRILELSPDWMWLGGGDKNVKFVISSATSIFHH